MARAKVWLLLASALIFGSAAGALAQGTADSIARGSAGIDRNGSPNRGTGTAVKTGRGPLSQPIPPAVSATNPQQNPQRPLNTWGPQQTNPPPQPFGSQ